MNRKSRRALRACHHLCERLQDAGAGVHVPRRINGAWRPFPAGAQSRLDNRSKRTSVHAYEKTVHQTITARGTGVATHRKHTVRYQHENWSGGRGWPTKKA